MLAFEIVARAESGWPYNAVPYSQTTVWSDGYRQDCSGFASMAAGLPAPGLSTVTFLTTGTVRLIGWSELAAGDFVGALGPGTEGDAGHIMVVESVDHTAGTYTVLEQAGYGPGPDRNTYSIGDGQRRNYLPYRLTNLEENMAETFVKDGDGNWWFSAGDTRRKITQRQKDDIAYWHARAGRTVTTCMDDDGKHPKVFVGADLDIWGLDVATLTGGPGGGPTHDELVQAAFEGAQQAEKE